MSAEFRQRAIGEYIKILKRRKWLILLPFLTMSIAVGYVVFHLPSMYESKSLLTLKPPTISQTIIQSLSTEDLSQRLQTISQEVLSRSSLEPMVVKYRLYEAERDAGMPMEQVIEKVYKNITIELERNDNEKVAAFSVSYKYLVPKSAQNVTAELASKFVNAQTISQTLRAETTQDFVENQANQAKTQLDVLEKQRLEIMMSNVETLPESSQGLIAQLEGLRQREQGISKEKETIISERGRINDNIRALNSQMRLIDDFGTRENREKQKDVTSVEQLPAYVDLIKKRAELTANLENLKITLRDKHPKVIEAQNNIQQINNEIDKLKAGLQARAATVTVETTRNTDLQKQNLTIEKQKYESQLTQIEQQLVYKDQETQQNAAQIAILESKINSIPNVKVALEGINTQYESAKKTYNELLEKKNSTEMMVGVESNAQGETIRVQDAANLPSAPANASKKPMLVMIGSMLGLALGVFFVGIIEVPRLFKIQNVEDAKHYTGLPVLASVPPLYSHKEIAWKNRANWFKLIAGVAVAVGLIPVMIMLLQATHIFDRLVS